MSKHRTTKSSLPKLPTISSIPQGDGIRLPFNGNAVGDGRFAFSFAYFDRKHDLFLGGKNEDGTVGGRWFLDFLDCLNNVSSITFQQLKESKTYNAHPVNWKTANASCPSDGKQLEDEYWQFRINKSRGRVVGFLIDFVFYIVWLDPHHNLTDSEGYSGVDNFNRPRSEYKKQEDKMLELKADNEHLRSIIQEQEALLDRETQSS